MIFVVCIISRSDLIHAMPYSCCLWAWCRSLVHVSLLIISLFSMQTHHRRLEFDRTRDSFWIINCLHGNEFILKSKRMDKCKHDEKNTLEWEKKTMRFFAFGLMMFKKINEKKCHQQRCLVFGRHSFREHFIFGLYVLFACSFYSL